MPNQRARDMVLLSIWLPRDLLEQFDLMYPRRGSRSKWIHRAIRTHVDQCGSPQVRALIEKNKKAWEEKRVLAAVRKRSELAQLEDEQLRRLDQLIADMEANKGNPT